MLPSLIDTPIFALCFLASVMDWYIGHIQPYHEVAPAASTHWGNHSITSCHKVSSFSHNHSVWTTSVPHGPPVRADSSNRGRSPAAADNQLWSETTPKSTLPVNSMHSKNFASSIKRPSTFITSCNPVSPPLLSRDDGGRRFSRQNLHTIFPTVGVMVKSTVITPYHCTTCCNKGG